MAEPKPTPIDGGKAKAPRKAPGPRPAYILINLPDGVDAAEVTVVDATRKAEDALEAIDSGRAGAYLRIMIK